MHFSNSVLIRRAPSDVFAFLADPANIPRWNYAITSTEQVTPGPFGLGTRLIQTRSLPQPSVEELEVVEYVPDRRLSLRGDLGPLTGTLTYVLDDAAEGTLLTNIADLSGRGPLGAVAGLGESGVSRAVAANLDALRELLELPT